MPQSDGTRYTGVSHDHLGNLSLVLFSLSLSAITALHKIEFSVCLLFLAELCGFDWHFDEMFSFD